MIKVDRFCQQKAVIISQQLNIFWTRIMIKEYFSSRKKVISSPLDSSSKKQHQVDRFIPHSISKNLYSLFSETKYNTKITSPSTQSCQSQNYSEFLERNLITDTNDFNSRKLLHFGQENKAPYYDKENIDLNILSVYEKLQVKHRKNKKVLKEPYKILEAPMLKDDFYLNLVDWSDQNQIGVGLNSSLFVWSGCSSKVKKLYESQNISEEINSVGFMQRNSKICIGTNQGSVKIFDIQKPQLCTSIQNLHSGRIGSISCTNNLVVTGSKDGYVSIQDYRTNSEVYRYKAHQQEISGLRISPNNDMIATGGNDNKLLLFSLKKMDKIISWNDHRAAVKAISFNPLHQSIASGGGTADKKVRIFSLQTFQKLSQIDTGSQICNMKFSPVSNQLITTHGYSLNQIILWKWDQNCQLTKVQSMMGHKNRVLYLAGERQGPKIITGAGDEELRLWNIFDDSQRQSANSYDLR